jgi:hypothetical protein
LTTLIRDYIAVPLLSASVTEEEGDPLSHPEIALVESRPNALQRSTAMSAKVLHEEVVDETDPPPPPMLPVQDK